MQSPQKLRQRLDDLMGAPGEDPDAIELALRTVVQTVEPMMQGLIAQWPAEQLDQGLEHVAVFFLHIRSDDAPLSPDFMRALADINSAAVKAALSAPQPAVLEPAAQPSEVMLEPAREPGTLPPGGDPEGTEVPGHPIAPGGPGGPSANPHAPGPGPGAPQQQPLAPEQQGIQPPSSQPPSSPATSTGVDTGSPPSSMQTPPAPPWG